MSTFTFQQVKWRINIQNQLLLSCGAGAVEEDEGSCSEASSASWCRWRWSCSPQAAIKPSGLLFTSSMSKVLFLFLFRPNVDFQLSRGQTGCFSLFWVFHWKLVELFVPLEKQVSLGFSCHKTTRLFPPLDFSVHKTLQNAVKVVTESQGAAWSCLITGPLIASIDLSGCMFLSSTELNQPLPVLSYSSFCRMRGWEWWSQVSCPRPCSFSSSSPHSLEYRWRKWR